jgi:hypothetical protein
MEEQAPKAFLEQSINVLGRRLLSWAEFW